MINKEAVYIEIGEVKVVEGMKLRAVKDEHEPFLSCKHCYLGGDSLIGLCVNMSCQKSVREDGIGVVFEFTE